MKLEKLGLSYTDQEVISLICDGYTSKEIGDITGTSKRTIEGRRKRILRRLDLKNTAMLGVFAVKHKIV